MGETRFPQPPCARATPAPTLPPGGGWGNPGFPSPLRTGCTRPHPPTGWGRGGNPVSPFPCEAGAWGNPGFPTPLLRGTIFTLAIHAARAAPRRDENNSWEGYALPHPPAGGGLGNPGFPSPLTQQPMFTVDGHAHGAHRRDDHDLGARASRPRRGRGAGPLPDPPPLGAGTRLLPPAGGRLGGGLNAANDGHLSANNRWGNLETQLPTLPPWPPAGRPRRPQAAAPAWPRGRDGRPGLPPVWSAPGARRRRGAVAPPGADRRRSPCR